MLLGLMYVCFASAHVQARELRLGIGAIPLFAPVIIADEDGFFKLNNLSDLKVVNCIIGKRCLEQLLNGQMQLAAVATTPLAFASFERRDFDIVATITTTLADNKFMVRADRGIKTPADLRGKKIGIVRGTSSQFFVESILLFYGIPLNQVTLVDMDPLDMVGPLSRGQVDAAGSFEPFGYQARQVMGDKASVLKVPHIVKISVHLVAARGANGPTHDELVRVLKALKQASDFMKSNPSKAIRDVSIRLKMPPSQVQATWDDYDYDVNLDQALVSNLESQALWIQGSSRHLAHAKIPNYLDLIRPGPLRAVDPQSVTLVK